MKKLWILFAFLWLVFCGFGVQASDMAATLYLDSIAEENQTTEVKSGNLIVNIPIDDSIGAGETAISVFAIYDLSGKLTAVSSSVAPVVGNEVTLSIEDFEADNDEIYTAKAFLWDENLKGNSFLLTENAINYLDFIVPVESGREPVVLQLTDTQIIDASQERYEDRLDAVLDAYWATDKMDERCFDYVKETVNVTKPDLILITGDLTYGSFDDNGSAMLKLIDLMESFDIPWAPVFGNHEAETEKGIDWVCDQLEAAPNCLFRQRSLTGNGNYSVGLVQGGEVKRVFFMLDSNGCSGMSSQSSANGHSKGTVGFGADQISWYTDVAQKVKNVSPATKISFAFHIQPLVFKEAYAKYGFTNSNTINNPINIDRQVNKAATDFGYLGRDLKAAWDTDYSVFNGMKALGTDSIFVGHEHCNSASVVYEGIRFQFGQKSSTYDRANYINSQGYIVGSYTAVGTPIMGGTVMKLSQSDGSIADAYIYYCEVIKEAPELAPENNENLVVNGFGFENGALSLQSGLTKTKVSVAGENAYSISAGNQGKLYVNTALVFNQDSLTFSVYLPEKSSNRLGGLGEFAIRWKTAQKNGYVDFATDATDNTRKLVFDTWKTYTVNVASLGTEFTEFSFVLPEGNTIYFKDIGIVGTTVSDGNSMDFFNFEKAYLETDGVEKQNEGLTTSGSLLWGSLGSMTDSNLSTASTWDDGRSSDIILTLPVPAQLSGIAIGQEKLAGRQNYAYSYYKIIAKDTAEREHVLFDMNYLSPKYAVNVSAPDSLGKVQAIIVRPYTKSEIVSLEGLSSVAEITDTALSFNEFGIYTVADKNQYAEVGQSFSDFQVFETVISEIDGTEKLNAALTLTGQGLFGHPLSSLPNVYDGTNSAFVFWNSRTADYVWNCDTSMELDGIAIYAYPGVRTLTEISFYKIYVTDTAGNKHYLYDMDHQATGEYAVKIIVPDTIGAVVNVGIEQYSKEQSGVVNDDALYLSEFVIYGKCEE